MFGTAGGDVVEVGGPLWDGGDGWTCLGKKPPLMGI